MVRQSIAERLVDINYALQQSAEVTALLGGKVELYINEGYRSRKLQRQLYEEIFPELIRKQHPKFTAEQVSKLRSQLIALPPRVGSPSPHTTGAAIDVRLRYAQPEPGFVPHTGVLLARRQADMGAASWPDYYEYQTDLNKKDQEIQRNRRIFYWIMRGALTEEESDFVVNPMEWWHWSYGDQLWAQLTEAPEAFFSTVSLPV
jgi:D-alanyl-D-alanine dipeptidase